MPHADRERHVVHGLVLAASWALVEEVARHLELGVADPAALGPDGADVNGALRSRIMPPRISFSTARIWSWMRPLLATTRGRSMSTGPPVRSVIAAAGLLDDDGRGGDVPRAQASAPRSRRSARPRRTRGRGAPSPAAAPPRARTANAAYSFRLLSGFVADVVGEAGREQARVEASRRRHRQRRVVAATRRRRARPRTARRGSGRRRRRARTTPSRSSAIDDRVDGQPVRVVGGAVERVDHPAAAGAPRRGRCLPRRGSRRRGRRSRSASTTSASARPSISVTRLVDGALEGDLPRPGVLAMEELAGGARGVDGHASLERNHMSPRL